MARPRCWHDSPRNGRVSRIRWPLRSAQDQRHAVTKKQRTFDPIAAHQQITQRHDRARLARARGHHHEGLAVLVLLERFADATDGAGLVIAFDNRLVDFCLGQFLPRGAPLD